MTLLETIRTKWPDTEVIEKNKIPEIIITPELLIQVAEFLKDNEICKFDMLVNQTGVDWKDSLMVVYHLRCTSNGTMLVLKTRTADRENPLIDTVSSIWRTAEFHEREIFDLFGIRFRNHPDMRRIFLDDDWTGYPLRKDYTDTINIIEK
jgi:NADH-quinone oxidoreductase subunit C